MVFPTNKEVTIDSNLKNIKKRDIKLLSLLAENSRGSLKELGKGMRLSKVAVYNKIKSLEKQRIILDYTISIDFTKLGFEYFQFGIKTNMTLQEKEDYIEKLKKMDFVIGIFQFSGQPWDFLIWGLTQRENFNENYDKIAENKIGKIQVFEISKGFAINSQKEYFKIFDSKNEKISLSKNEVNLLWELSKNSRIKIVDLSSKLKLSSKTIISLIKKLNQKKIITSYMTRVNPKIFGSEEYLLMVDTRKRKDQENILKNLVKIHSTGGILNIQNPNIFSFHTISSLKELQEIENSLEKNEENILSYDFIKINKNVKYITFPRYVYDCLKNSSK